MRLSSLLLAGLLLLAPAGPALAQLAGMAAIFGASSEDAAEGSADGQGSEAADRELRALISTLKDPAAREQLIANLEALLEANRRQAAAPEAAPPAEEDKTFGAEALEAVVSGMSELSEQLVDAFSAFGELPGAMIEGVERLEQPEIQRRFLEVVATLAAIVIGGFLAEFLVGRLLARPRRTLDDKPAESWPVRLLYLLLRLFLDLVPIAAFAAATYGILTVADTDRTTDVVALAFINANVLDRAVRLVGRIVLVPRNRAQRLLPLEDETAQYLYVWLSRLSIIGIYGFMATQVALTLGLDRAAQLLLVNLLSLLIAAMLVMFVLQQRKEVSRWFRGERNGLDGQRERGAFGGLRDRLADIWHVLAILYIAVAYLVFALDIENGFAFLARATLLTVVIAVGARMAVQLAARLVERGFRLDEETRQRFPLLEERLNRYLPVLQGILSVAVGLVAVLLLFEVWGAAPFEWLVSAPGRAFVGQCVKILLVIGGSFLVWEVVSSLIESYLRGRPGGRSARTTTLLKLFQTSLRVLLAVLAVLVVLSELGLDIAPLLAGAGVVGLAVGFGAQTLVKDVITGIFMLMENTIAVGDVVEIAGHSGVVEQVSIRTAHLRDLSGSLHVVPFSDVTSVVNYGRGFAYALVDMRVAYREDVDEVIEVLKEIAAGLREDEAFKDAIVDDLEVLGLDSFGTSEVIVRVRLKTLPLKQWGVKREFQKRIKKVFDERGIEIPLPHQRIYFGAGKDGTAPPVRLVHEPSSAERALEAGLHAEGPAETGEEPKPGRRE